MRVVVALLAIVVSAVVIGCALTVGADQGNRAPDFALPNSDGQMVTLDSTGRNPVVLVFYGASRNGGHEASLIEFEKNAKEFSQIGVTLVAITDDAVDAIVQTKARVHPSFPILRDADRSVMVAYGVVQLGQTAVRPATFVMDARKVIRWKHIGRNNGDRPAMATVLAEAREMNYDNYLRYKDATP